MSAPLTGHLELFTDQSLWGAERRRAALPAEGSSSIIPKRKYLLQSKQELKGKAGGDKFWKTSTTSCFSIAMGLVINQIAGDGNG